MEDKKAFCPCCGTELARIDYDYDNGDCIYYCKNCEEQMTQVCDVDDMNEKLQRIKDLENFKIEFLEKNKLSFLDNKIYPQSIKQIECIVLDDIDNEVYRLRQEIEFFDLE